MSNTTITAPVNADLRHDFIFLLADGSEYDISGHTASVVLTPPRGGDAVTLTLGSGLVASGYDNRVSVRVESTTVATWAKGLWSGYVKVVSGSDDDIIHTFGVNVCEFGAARHGESTVYVGESIVTLGARGPAGMPWPGDGDTVIVSTPLFDLDQIWNAAGVAFTALKLNITDTASAAGSLLLDLQVGAASKFSVRKDGHLVSAVGAAFGAAVTIAGGTAWHSGNDGAGSGLDADLLDGQSSAYYLAAGSYTAADVFAKVLTLDGAGSGLDADLLDGLNSADFALASHSHIIGDVTGLQAALDAKLASADYTAADVLAKLVTVDGAGSGLDADTLDGLSSAAFAAASHTHAQSDVTGLVAALAAKLDAASYTAADVLAKMLTVDGSGSGLDADLLDGETAADFHAWANLTGVPTTASGWLTDVVLTSGAQTVGGAKTFSSALAAPGFTASTGIIAASAPVWSATQTWNNAGVTFTGMFLNITDTASAAASLLLDLQVGGTSRFNVGVAGNIGVNIAAPSGIYNLHIRSPYGGVSGGGLLIDNNEDNDLRFAITLKAGLTTQGRRYIYFRKYDLDEGWLVGANQTNDFIIYNGSGHAFISGSGTNADLSLNASGNGIVKFNVGGSVGGGTGGVVMYSGDVAQTRFFSFESTGAYAWVGLPFQTISPDGANYTEIITANGTGKLRSNTKLIMQGDSTDTLTLWGGKVGIGNTSPAVALDITGQVGIGVAGAHSADYGITIRNGSFSGSDGYIAFVNGAGATEYARINMNQDGLLKINGVTVELAAGGTSRVAVGPSNQLAMRSDGVLQWSSTTAPTGTPDLLLLRDGAANTLGLRNGPAAQTLRLYNTETDPSNYERGRFAWVSNWLEIGTEAAGTGTARGVVLMSATHRVAISGITNAFPALRRSGTSLEAVLADNSAYTGFNADTITAAANRSIVAGGIAGVGVKVSTTANFGMFFGSGPPTISAAKGSLYLRSDGSGTGDRAYINTDGGTTWTAVTTAA